MKDDLSDVEAGTIDQLLYIGAGEIANLRTVLGLGWLQEEVSETEHDAILWLRALNYENSDTAAALMAMPFLETAETDDVLAIRAMHRLGRSALLSPLLEHSSFQDGISDEETTLVAAAGTLRDADEISRMLDLGYASIEAVAQPTERTPNLRISIVRTETQSRPGTIEAVRDAVDFVEGVMQLPLPVDHVIVLLNEKAVIDDYAGVNHGFAVSYLPEYEQPQDTSSWKALQAGIVHEIAHYYWRGNADWIDEGLSDTIEYVYGVAKGLSPGQLKAKRRDCEAHDLRMLSDSNPEMSNSQFRCNYYLGQLLFLELLESLGDAKFSEKLLHLYLVSVKDDKEDGTPGIETVRQVFQDQADIIGKHWSGALNAPENRAFDDGLYRTNHALIQWNKRPTHDSRVTRGNAVSFTGT